MAVLHASREREIAIKTSKLIAVGLVALAMLTFTGCIAGTLGITEMNQVYCQTVFFDNFEDGSATDGMPVTWSPSLLAEGTVDVVDGNYVAMGSVPRAALCGYRRFALSWTDM